MEAEILGIMGPNSLDFNNRSSDCDVYSSLDYTSKHFSQTAVSECSITGGSYAMHVDFSGP